MSRSSDPSARSTATTPPNVAMRLAKPAGVPPREVAELIAKRLADLPGIERVDVAGPGFLNIVLEAAAQGVLARQIVEPMRRTARRMILAGLPINVEFIANPTGPLTSGIPLRCRWATPSPGCSKQWCARDARVLHQRSWISTRSFRRIADGCRPGKPVPEDGYHGEYIGELSQRVVDADPDILKLPNDKQLVAFARPATPFSLPSRRSS